MKDLKLYVFDSFDPAYEEGLAFAIALSEEEAKKLILKSGAYNKNDLDYGGCTVHNLNEKVAYSIPGGG